MANYIQDEITFNNVKDGGKTPASTPVWTGKVGADEFGGIINAVDIDWNGAEVDTDHDHDINTTGQLINYIKGAYSSGGSSQSGGLNADEIDKLRELISSDSPQDTTIKNLDSRIFDLDNRILKLEQFLSNNVKTKLTNLISRASKVTLTTNSGYLYNIKVEPASGGGNTITGQTVGGIEKLDGAVHTGVVNITDDLATKLDHTAINYDGSGNLTVNLD